MIYEPREDSFLLVRYVREYAKGSVLDIGTGSGIQAEIALKNKCKVLATDIDKEAVNFVRKKGLRAIVSNLFDNVKGKFDLIIFNPPYLPEDKDEPKDSRLITTGGKDGFEVLERFLKDAKNYLKKDGKILIVFSSLTGNVDKILKKYNYEFECLEEKKLFFETLYIYLIKAKVYK